MSAIITRLPKLYRTKFYFANNVYTTLIKNNVNESQALSVSVCSGVFRVGLLIDFLHHHAPNLCLIVIKICIVSVFYRLLLRFCSLHRNTPCLFTLKIEASRRSATPVDIVFPHWPIKECGGN